MSISKKSTKVLAALAALPLLAALAGCATTSDANVGSSDAAAGASETVKIGVVGKSDPQWPAFVDAAAAEGITVEIIDFGSYDAPNPALTAGDLDLNQFQHIVYLADYNVSSGEDLAVIGSTAIYPLNLYSTEAAMGTLYTLQPLPRDAERARTRAWTKIKSGT